MTENLSKLLDHEVELAVSKPPKRVKGLSANEEAALKATLGATDDDIKEMTGKLFQRKFKTPLIPSSTCNTQF